MRRGLFSGVVLACVLASCLPATASAQEPLDTRITSSPPNLHRSADAVFTFDGRIGDGDWGSCAYDPDVDDFVCATDFECSLDGAPWTTCRPVLTLRGLPDGYHVFAVRAVNGGESDPTPATRLFRVRLTGEECSRAVYEVERAEEYIEDVLYGLSIEREKLREWKRIVRRSTGRDLERARERLQNLREEIRKSHRHLREARSRFDAARAQRDAACGA